MAMNLTLSNKNPFSTFDFLGYLFPGALMLTLVYVLTDGMKHLNMTDIHEYSILLKLTKGNVIMESIIFIIFSYVTGHLISYLSSVTVELFYTWCYGYPTDYLFVERKRKSLRYIIPQDISFFNIVWRVIICFTIFPVLIAHNVFERLFQLQRFITKPLPSAPQVVINKKVKEYFVGMGFNAELFSGDKKPSEDIETHRFVMHYVYEHCKEHIVKFDNYVALYGFLRALTLIFSICFIYKFVRLIFWGNIYLSGIFPDFMNNNVIRWVVYFLMLFILLIYIFKSDKIRKECASDENNRKKTYVNVKILINSLLNSVSYSAALMMSVGLFFGLFYKGNNVGETMILFILFVSSYISYLSFAKFYRRFSLENFMALVICNDINAHKKNEIPSKIEVKLNDQIIHLSIDDKKSVTGFIMDYLQKKSDRSK